MPTFTKFSDTLPDPFNPITDAGDIASYGEKGPGFSSMNFRSVTNTQVSRTNSGRGVLRDNDSQHWEFSIQYNPMFRNQFDLVDAFLQGRNPRRDPFYVMLPQYSKSRSPAFAAYVAGGRTFSLAMPYDPGASAILVNVDRGTIPTYPRPGDMISITDAADYNHQKVYKISAIENTQYWQAGTTQPLASQMRLHISPPLQRATTQGAVVSFSPKFRVITKGDVQEYSLDTENLYSFSLDLEEIQP